MDFKMILLIEINLCRNQIFEKVHKIRFEATHKISQFRTNCSVTCLWGDMMRDFSLLIASLSTKSLPLLSVRAQWILFLFIMMFLLDGKMKHSVGKYPVLRRLAVSTRLGNGRGGREINWPQRKIRETCENVSLSRRGVFTDKRMAPCET